jgi:peroxiredoxin
MVIGVILYAAVRIAGDEISLVNAGTRAPQFSALTLSTPPASKSLADYEGYVVLLNIWRTDCAPCEKEMPSIETLYREFRDRGFKVVAVSVDPPGSETRIREFAQRYDLTFDILFDTAAVIEDIYQTRGWPESCVIGRDGIITRKVWGDQNWASLPNRSLIAQLLGETVPSVQLEPATNAGVTGGDE